MLRRLLALIRKELQIVLSNPKSRAMLIMPVVLQVVLFPFAATMEVKHATLAVYNQDSGSASVEVIQRLSRTAAFDKIKLVHSGPELREAMESQEALLAVAIPSDFSRRLLARESAPLQTILDGRRSNSSQIAGAWVMPCSLMISRKNNAQGRANRSNSINIRAAQYLMYLARSRPLAIDHSPFSLLSEIKSRFTVQKSPLPFISINLVLVIALLVLMLLDLLLSRLLHLRHLASGLGLLAFTLNNPEGFIPNASDHAGARSGVLNYPGVLRLDAQVLRQPIPAFLSQPVIASIINRQR